MTVDRERWLRLSQLFDAAIELDPDARGAFLDAECAGDSQLRDELQRMLDADAQASDFDAGAAAAVSLQDDAGVADDDTGERLGAWRLDRLLGRGGMGSVYAARREDDDTGQQAAIKRLRRRWDGSAQAQRFLQERRILARLSHPNIPALLDHGLDDDGRPWFALEFVDGATLVEWADAHRLGLRERIELFLQVCAAVQHAHERFVVHRDLKPANILVDADGRARVLDFGVAKRLDVEEMTTRTGLFAGFTPEYAAPEQVRGGTITAATDVYALGVLLYELLSGKRPYRFDQADLRDAAEAITTRNPERLDRAVVDADADDAFARMQARATTPTAYRRYVRGDLARIAQTALAKEPARRYASVQAFANDLRHFLAGRPVSVTGDSFAYRTRKFVQRNRWGVAMGAVALLALAAGVTGVLVKSAEARREAERAMAEAKRATAQSERADREVERLSVVNGFMASIFSGADANRSGSARLSLKDALDHATATVASDYAGQPQLQVLVMQAASESYTAMGDTARSEALLRDALRIQERDLPQGREERALLLASLAYERANYEPANALRWAREALALQKAANPDNLTGMLAALSGLVAVQYANDDPAGALATTREGIAVMKKAGLGIEDPRYQGAMSSLALTLAELRRYGEAARVHEQIIAERRRKDGGESRAVALERSYYARSLLLAGRFGQALQQIELALPVLQHDLGEAHVEVVTARMRQGIALSGLGRHAEALPLLAAVHAYGRDHPFEDRQASAGHAYAHELALLGRCDEANAVVAELHARNLDPAQDGKSPMDGSACVH